MHKFERSTLALAVVSFTLMNQYLVINLAPEENVESLRQYVVKLTHNAEEKSFHKDFYKTFEDFISVACREIVPVNFCIHDWD